MKINVVDAIMGAGKTSAAINYINQSPDERKFIYITPFLNEVERIKASCQSKHFYSPSGKGSKLVNLKTLLNRGTNIVTTHALFHMFDDEVIDLCYDQGYVLIMDEVTDVIEPYLLTDADRELLFSKYLEMAEDGATVIWKKDQHDYCGRFDDVKRLADMGCLASYGGNMMLWLFPIKVFNAFRDSYVLTYMFNGQMQKYYYDYYGLEYNYLYVARDSKDTYCFTEDVVDYSGKYEYNKLINIIHDDKMNMLGDAEHALSKSWYERNKHNTLIAQLKKNTSNFFRNKKVLYQDGGYVKSSTSNNLWTTFKDYYPILKGKGYATGFAPSNARATNDYAERTVVAYLVNKYVNPVVKQFFTQHGITVLEDEFALSEMLQFIWRSGIRNGEHITVYIPSSRMRGLLERWINNAKSNLCVTGL